MTEESYIRGSWDGRTYTNEKLGFTFELPMGWTVYTEKEILKEMGLKPDMYEEDDQLLQAIAMRQIIYDFYVYDQSGVPGVWMQMCIRDRWYGTKTFGDTTTGKGCGTDKNRRRQRIPAHYSRGRPEGYPLEKGHTADRGGSVYPAPGNIHPAAGAAGAVRPQEVAAEAGFADVAGLFEGLSLIHI